MEKHTVAKLIGSPPGYVGFQDGGQLTEAVRLKPYSIVLFDEVEKAHPDVFNLFLQILDDGHLTDSSSRVVNFKNTIIVMTTNLGARVIEKESPLLPKDEKPFGFSRSLQSDRRRTRVELDVNPDGSYTIKPPTKPEITAEETEKFGKITELVQEELKKFFRPEFLNRIDDIIVFNHLTKHDLWEICGLMLGQLTKRLKEKNAILTVDSAVRYFLTEEGYNPIYGARPLRRAITKFLEDKLSEECLYNELHKDTRINVKLKTKIDSTPNYFEEFDNVFAREIVVEFDYSDVNSITVQEEEKQLQENRSDYLETSRKYKD
jgi:ATP-dependent Clp protease ATP-binding subunit ClpC